MNFSNKNSNLPVQPHKQTTKVTNCRGFVYVSVSLMDTDEILCALAGSEFAINLMHNCQMPNQIAFIDRSLRSDIGALFLRILKVELYIYNL